MTADVLNSNDDTTWNHGVLRNASYDSTFESLYDSNFSASTYTHHTSLNTSVVNTFDALKPNLIVNFILYIEPSIISLLSTSPSFNSLSAYKTSIATNVVFFSDIFCINKTAPQQVNRQINLTKPLKIQKNDIYIYNINCTKFKNFAYKKILVNSLFNKSLISQSATKRKQQPTVNKSPSHKPLTCMISRIADSSIPYSILPKSSGQAKQSVESTNLQKNQMESIAKILQELKPESKENEMADTTNDPILSKKINNYCYFLNRLQNSDKKQQDLSYFCYSPCSSASSPSSAFSLPGVSNHLNVPLLPSGGVNSVVNLRTCFPLFKKATLEKIQNTLTLKTLLPQLIKKFSIPYLSAIQIAAVPKLSRNLKFFAGAKIKPHPDKIKTGGEDAYFISIVAPAVGVADGVSQWNSYGVNPGVFAMQLMEYCSKIEVTCTNDLFDKKDVNLAQSILFQGFRNVNAFGGSTVTIGCIDWTGSYLHVCNLGDSTLILLRRNQFTGMMECVFRTVEQQHAFNTPYQLTRLPNPDQIAEIREQGLDKLASAAEIHNIQHSIDTPYDAAKYSVPIQQGDLVVLGSDGLFDNLYEEDICHILSLAISPYEAENSDQIATFTQPQHIASILTKMASHIGHDHEAKTPFAENAKKAGYISTMENFAGGKLDDIVVVACWIN